MRHSAARTLLAHRMRPSVEPLKLDARKGEARLRVRRRGFLRWFFWSGSPTLNELFINPRPAQARFKNLFESGSFIILPVIYPFLCLLRLPIRLRVRCAGYTEKLTRHLPLALPQVLQAMSALRQTYSQRIGAQRGGSTLWVV